MTAVSTGLSSTEILEHARAYGREQNLPFPGALGPDEAWQLVERGDAVLVDVRTAEEFKFVGHVPGSHHVAWQTGTALIKNPRFVKELEQKTGKDKTVLLLCRSAKRSALAAEAAAKAGFANVFNVLEGFEGDKDENQQRGVAGGWRLRGLPWEQD
jgi:rhodanese-related sulfurtransferase